jgi:RNA polymerase sigma factor (sigma-70 family)
MRATFAEQVAAARPRVVAVATRLVGDEAEDVAQEAALRAFLSLSQLRDPDRFEAWLCGIAVNLAKMRLRRAATYARAVAGAPPPPAPDDHELLELVRDAVEVLPPGQRDAVLLHYVDDLSCEEVAALLDTTPGAVRVRLHRARAQLRRELAPQLIPTSRPREEPMIETTLSDVLVRLDDDSHVLWDGRIAVLHEREGGRYLPILIGAPEGNSLAMHLQEGRQPRPMTADLMAELVRALGGEVRSVAVTRIEEKVFYATIDVGGGAEVDARPSDAINLAVRTGAPILVAEAVLEEAGVTSEGLHAKLSRDAEAAGFEVPPGRWGSLTGELMRTFGRPTGK